ncbi:amidase [Paenibacillus sp. UNCCL117]|uniref:amidase family protein n=1 Tax=unclassified Paenibacillus TaxID=185978 RepID=UPI00088271C4|nr:MULTISPECIES: amidase family protein [unclassified Paenibacillus]SDE28895.1 amidase [Paenibacillus sp. cl123]SFW63379.1 amidase [Paenibacillus sp. UNCCL117]
MTQQLPQHPADLTIAEQQAGMESGVWTSEQLVQAYLDRIARYDGRIRSVLELNPDALAIARGLDHERKVCGARGPMHGIPVLLKDNIDTCDRMHTSAGSIALQHWIAPEDAFIVRKLREAGAVLLGKTNMTEWANFMSDTMFAGYSSRGGQVVNPYGADLLVSGSSTGSAAAVAAGFCSAAVGTETSGSIIAPACRQAIVGLKPTVGLLSRTGIIPISHSQDTPGPMARTVADAAALLGVMTGADPQDAATLERVEGPAAVAAFSAERTRLDGANSSDGPDRLDGLDESAKAEMLNESGEGAGRLLPNDYTRFLDADFLRQARLGIPASFFQSLEEDVKELMRSALSALRQAGASLIEDVRLPAEETGDWSAEVLRHEFKAGINRYLSRLDAGYPVHSLTELIAYHEQHAEQALKYGQSTLLWADQVSGSLTEPAYLESRARDLWLSRDQGIDHALRTYELDALLLPGDGITEEGAILDMAAKAGYPVVTVPAGFARQGPVGLLFIGTAYSEPTLIRLAYGYEQLTLHRRPPELKQLPPYPRLS